MTEITLTLRIELPPSVEALLRSAIAPGAAPALAPQATLTGATAQPAAGSPLPSTTVGAAGAGATAAAPSGSGAAPAGAAAAPELTQEVVRKAMTDYVGRGNGRSAATAKAILVAHGLQAVKDAQPGQFQALYNAFTTG